MPIVLNVVNRDNYSFVKRLVNENQWGNAFLPETYSSSLWGVLAQDGDQVKGAWVGTLRGAGKMTSWLAKSVYFDSYPCCSDGVDCKMLVDYAYRKAKEQGFVMFNMTHWVRGCGMKLDQLQKGATFLVDLHQSEDELWKGVESKQRNIIRKGEKSGVEVLALRGNDALKYLNDFQQLRQLTQQRAIGKNASASMLLKSNSFFENLFLQPEATLFVGKVEEKIATVALMLVGGRTVYYFSGGSDYELNKKTGSSAYVIWKSILYYQNQNDVEYFDMGGVPVFDTPEHPNHDHPAYGVFQFKRSFGGKYMEFDGGKIVINPIKFKVLDWVMKQRKLLRIFSKFGL